MKIKVMRVGPIQTNCYILEDEASGLAAVIDPGDQAEDIKALLDQEQMEVRYILLTHGHFDHTTGVAPLLALLGEAPEVYIHKADAAGAGISQVSLEEQVADLRCYGEGDRLQLGSLDIQVLHTPGHSRGSVTLKVGDVLFTGDTLFAGACGRTDFPGGSYPEIMQSLKRLGELEGDYHVCPGHEGTSTLERERRTNPFLLEAMRG